MKNAVSEANGMLPLAVYEEIHRLAGLSQDGSNFVEVGTGHGAATIAMAMGASSSNRDVMIHTIDCLDGKFSSRKRFGSVSENEEIVRRNFSKAKVKHCTDLFVGTSDEYISADLCPKKIDMLVLDADGQIDRDLLYFYRRMEPGTPIVIDDVDSKIYFDVTYDGARYIDLKHRIVSMLLKKLEHAGYIRVIKRIENTAFCERGNTPLDKAIFVTDALECYRKLLHLEAVNPTWLELAQWKERTRLVRTFPNPVVKLAREVWRRLPASLTMR